MVPGNNKDGHRGGQELWAYDELIPVDKYAGKYWERGIKIIHT